MHNTINMFEIIKTNKKARRGKIVTEHGIIETPAFMPVATQAIIKGLNVKQMIELNIQTFIANTYHLYLRPGLEIIENIGGIHRFMNWNNPIVTDSGGFQVLSLTGLRKIKQDGVEFQSHIDGSYHKFTPENNVLMQRKIGSDIIMVLDECIEYPVTKDYAKQAVYRTLEWAKKAREEFLKTDALYDYKQYQFGIIQGSIYKDLRMECAEQLSKIDFDGYAMGGVAIGETKEHMKSIIDIADEIMPENKVRYLMGVGKLEDIEYAVKRGFDLFDCVIPTRNGRNGTLFTSKGKILIRNAKYKNDFSTIDEQCNCTLCSNYTKAYLHHLFRSGEISGPILATEHNINFYMRFMQNLRQRI